MLLRGLLQRVEQGVGHRWHGGRVAVDRSATREVGYRAGPGNKHPCAGGEGFEHLDARSVLVDGADGQVGVLVEPGELLDRQAVDPHDPVAPVRRFEFAWFAHDDQVVRDVLAHALVHLHQRGDLVVILRVAYAEEKRPRDGTGLRRAGHVVAPRYGDEDPLERHAQAVEQAPPGVLRRHDDRRGAGGGLPQVARAHLSPPEVGVGRWVEDAQIHDERRHRRRRLRGGCRQRRQQPVDPRRLHRTTERAVGPGEERLPAEPAHADAFPSLVGGVVHRVGEQDQLDLRMPRPQRPQRVAKEGVRVAALRRQMDAVHADAHRGRRRP